MASFNDRDRVAQILALIDDDDRRWLEDRLAAPSLRRARRLARRDALIREPAMQYQGFSSVRALVATIETALQRYLAGGFRGSWVHDLRDPGGHQRIGADLIGRICRKQDRHIRHGLVQSNSVLKQIETRVAILLDMIAGSISGAPRS